MSNGTNPYTDEKGQPVLRQSVVAFVDILGYRNLVTTAFADGSGEALLKELHESLSSALKSLNELDEEHNPIFDAFPNLPDRFRTQSFTDNLVIGYPIYRDGEIELGDVISKLSFFQLELAMNGFFVRGAISVGDLFIDDVTVIGPGLIEAYAGESQYARDPRVILTESAREAVAQHMGYYGNPKLSPQEGVLLKDADGQYFLDYLQTLWIAGSEHGPFYDELIKHKQSIEHRLVKHQSSPPIWAKYAWSAKYHNYFCDRYSEFDEQHKIDVSSYEAAPCSIAE